MKGNGDPYKEEERHERRMGEIRANVVKYAREHPPKRLEDDPELSTDRLPYIAVIVFFGVVLTGMLFLIWSWGLLVGWW